LARKNKRQEEIVSSSTKKKTNALQKKERDKNFLGRGWMPQKKRGPVIKGVVVTAEWTGAERPLQQGDLLPGGLRKRKSGVRVAKSKLEEAYCQ